MVFNVTFNIISVISWRSVLFSGRGNQQAIDKLYHIDIVSHKIAIYMNNSQNKIVLRICYDIILRSKGTKGR